MRVIKMSKITPIDINFEIISVYEGQMLYELKVQKFEDL